MSKRKTKEFDWEGALLAAGWNTESTSYQMRAFKSESLSTKWHSHWSLVHDEAVRMDAAIKAKEAA